MKGFSGNSFFSIESSSFEALDAFLSTVKGREVQSIQSSGLFPGFSDILRCLGFWVVQYGSAGILQVQFRDTGVKPTPKIAVPRQEICSDRWTITDFCGNGICVQWKGLRTDITAQEARELAQNAKDAQVILDNVCLAAKSGHFKFTPMKHPGEHVSLRLKELGFKVSDSNGSFCISWE